MPALTCQPLSKYRVTPNSYIQLGCQSNVTGIVGMWCGRRRICLVNGGRSKAAPIRVVRIKLQIPFWRGPVGNAKDGVQWKSQIHLCRTLRAGVAAYLEFRLAVQCHLCRTAESRAQRNFFIGCQADAEIVTHTPAIAGELKEVVAECVIWKFLVPSSCSHSSPSVRRLWKDWAAASHATTGLIVT